MLRLILSMALIVTSFAFPVQEEELAEVEPVVSIAEDAGEVSVDVSNVDILEERSDVISSDEPGEGILLESE